ncbi:MAG: FAD-dependent oxidoreductase [Gammaproteobacteria bacterium]|nr:FAD-dependent oxidoreductase [Gammaproteobacteria bacterium]
MDVDVVVIGGGIHGAGVAQAAAAAGHSVCVLEKTALAAGTSSRSSKLIHGGLRYLESAQFSLVRESLHERAVLLEIAPELVRLQAFHVPVYKVTRRRPWQLRIGLSLYAALAGFADGAGFGTVPRARWDSLDGLVTDGLQQVFRYHDGQTDDAALTRAVMASAMGLGATLKMPACFVGADFAREEVAVRYLAAGVESELTCRVLVNTAGPWAMGAANRMSPAIPGLPFDLVQGTHILLPGVLAQGIYYLEHQADGRAVFAMPRGRNTLVGTTERAFSGNPDDVAPTAEEIEYLLQLGRTHFHQYRNLQHADVLEAWAGLRVLPAGPGAAFGRSRETVLQTDRPTQPRVINVFGGKLTGYRATASHVLQRIAPSLPSRDAVATTDKLRLSPVE